MIHYKTLYFTINHAAKKKATPNAIAIIVIIITNLSNSIRNGDFGVKLV